MKGRYYTYIIAAVLALLFLANCGEKTSIKTEGKITLLVDSLEEKANGYLFSEPLKSCQLLKEALQQDLDKSRQAEIETLLAKAFFLSSQYDSVTFYGQKVISYCQEQDLSDVRIQRLLMEKTYWATNSDVSATTRRQSIIIWKPLSIANEVTSNAPCLIYVPI